MIRVAETRGDLECCVEICNAVQPEDPVVIEQFLGGPGCFLVHGRDGYAFVSPSSVAGHAFAMVRVLPPARRRGVGWALLAAAREHVCGLGLERLWGRVSDADGDARRFVRKRGFEEVTRDVNVVRTVAPGDGEVAPGIAELRDEHLRGAHEVCVECVPEIAVPQRAAELPYEEWLKRERRRSAVAFVALDGTTVVGYARLYETGLGHRLENGLTAVLRSHRRRGIATALKRAQLAWAAEHGYTEIVTQMVEGNAAMRAVNEGLGYRPLPASIVVSGSAR